MSEEHVCVVCGWVYEGSELDEGVHWNDLEHDFECPECGVGKSDFEVI
jgi:rubredoxin